MVSLFPVRNRMKQFLFLLALPVALSAAKVQVVSIPSPCMDRSLHTTVVLPDGYDRADKRYPVIYLLHGFGGNHQVWPRIAPIDSFADEFEIIFVCPEGKNSWYINSPADTTLRFETFITGELIAFIDSRYQTHANAGMRAIVGASMGGHGAITLFARHQDLYCGAGSISGIMDLTEFPEKWQLSLVFGEYRIHRAVWRKHSALHLATLLTHKGKALRFDCGNKDFALNGNRKMHARMKEFGIRHGYFEERGSHDARFVRRVARDHILFFVKRFSEGSR
jgi:S-formylglutathione hydrolase FrmB